MAGLDFSKIPTDLIMNIVNIVILYVIVRCLAYKPVKKFIDERRERAEAEKAEVARASAEAEALKAEYEQKLSEIAVARAEAVRAAEREGQAKADDMVQSAKRDAERIIGDARQAIIAKEAEAIDGIRESVVELSLSIASKVIDRNITDDDNRHLAEKFFEEESENIK